MNKGFFLLVFFLVNVQTQAQSLSQFTSILPLSQDQRLHIPSTHRFQILVQEGDSCLNGLYPPLFDFTAYVPLNGSSTKGLLSLNHEAINGAVTISHLEFNNHNNLWQISQGEILSSTSVMGLYRPCSGNITPWNTIIIGEEYLSNVDADSNGYFDNGWLCEIDPYNKQILNKCFACGRGEHENAAFYPDSLRIFFGNDNLSYGFIFKFICKQKGITDSGNLFVLKWDGIKAEWMQIPNQSISDRNNTYNLATALGATNFSGVEDMELGPDSMFYFASKGSGNIYRFKDGDSLLPFFDTFIVSQNYLINYGIDSAWVSWGVGQDNLAFDSDGNLWVLQDGGNNYIWMVGKNHNASQADIRLFGNIPAGAEPTGLTFTPDGKYMFLSIQHPYPSNIDTQSDATKNMYQWNKSTAIVIARTKYLGAFPDGLTDKTNFSGVKIWPNPASDAIFILLPEKQEIFNCELFSYDGKKIFAKQLHNENQILKIPLHHLMPNGFYYGIIHGEHQSYYFKFIKEF